MFMRLWKGRQLVGRLQRNTKKALTDKLIKQDRPFLTQARGYRGDQDNCNNLQGILRQPLIELFQ